MYLFLVALYVALYVAFSVTSFIVGVHPANSYVYSSVASFVGFSGFTISSAFVPSSYSVASFSTVVPSSSTKVTV